MADLSNLEVWQRGPLPNIPPLLQPAAHALLQAREELEVAMKDFPSASLWEKPGALASPAFHLQHLTGVLDRVFCYARGETLGKEQLEYLSLEGVPHPSITTNDLVNVFSIQVDKAIEQLSTTNESTLTEFRGVGRKMLPSTVIGLLFHAAEHTMRHLGQLLVTVKWIRNQ